MKARKFNSRCRGPVAALNVLAALASPAAALVDFPIGYACLGGTYGFIALIQSQKFLEKEGIQPKFIDIGGPQIPRSLRVHAWRLIGSEITPIFARAKFSLTLGL